jgi:dihydropteroate synthase
MARVIPVIRALAGRGAVVSADTRHPQVMAAALDAGARILNDVAALQAPGAPAIAAGRGVPVVLMHMQGEPQTMQAAPRYDQPALDVWDFLESRLAAFEAAGGIRTRALVDPGIGFGKNGAQNLALLRSLALFRGLGTGVLLGVSRKRLIDQYGGPAAAKDRLGGSLALALDGIDRGAQVLRVHDVAATVQALRLWQAVRQEE